MADSTVNIKIITSGNGKGGGGGAPSKTPNGTPNTPTPPGGGNGGGSGGGKPKPSSSSNAGGDSPSGGKSLAMFATGMALHQGFGALTHALGIIPGQKQNASMLGTIGGQAIAGATAGMMVGGPIGAAIGAGIGTATGAITALADAAKNARDALNSIREGARGQVFSMGMKRQDAHFERMLSGMNREQREEAIAERATQLRFGDGDASIRNLENWLSKAAKLGKTDTAEYAEKTRLLDQQRARVAHLQDLDDQNWFGNLPGLIQESSVSDSIQKMGGVVGPTVNVADANTRMIDLLQQILESSRTIASHAADSTDGINRASGQFSPRFQPLF